MNKKPSLNISEYQMLVLEKGQIDCIDVVKLMGDLREQELPHTLEGRLRTHISECPHCQKFEASYNQVVNLANELGQDRKPIPNDVKQRLRQALNQRLGIRLSVD